MLIAAPAAAASRTSSAAATATAAATTAIAAATAAATTTSTPTAASAATAAFSRRTGFVHDHVSSHKIVAIERLNGASCIIIAIHFDEAEATRLSREAIAHQSDIRRCNSYLREPVAHVLFCSLKRQVAHVQFFHELTP